ncbi:MAG: fibronectin type III domain-containing protein [Acidobacteria bacterium]|nr:fibronectin type III domain-containing protein [Acidobacteriota bacterium]
MPTAVTAQPIDAPEFREPVAFGEQRCYVVRTVALAPDTTESEATAPACVTPQDTFAPSPPQGLSALAVEGAINLLWEPGTEADLAGYLVLRGSPGDATLQRLTPLPIAEARFRDQAVVPGVAYEYAVVAVDRRQPSGNVSGESNRVTETAR